MPRLRDEIQPLLDQVVLDVGAAWPQCKVNKGASRIDETAPYAVVALDSIGNSFETMRTVQMAVTVKIHGVFAIPATGTEAGENLEDLKIKRLDELVALLEASTTYYELASLPLVAEFSLPDEDEEDCYRVEASFTCLSSGNWGNENP
jgi:hypothetical protein